jgi:hypothetical protein
MYYVCMYVCIYVFLPQSMPPHVHTDFVVPLPGCGRSVTDFWGWGAHRVRLRCPDDVSDMYERGVPGEGLKPKFYKLPIPWSLWGASPARGKFPWQNRESKPEPYV